MSILQSLRLGKLFGSGGSQGSLSGERGNARRKILTLLAVLGVLDVALVAMLFRPPSPSVADRQTKFEQSRTRYSQTLSTVQQMRELKTKLQSAIQKDREFSDSHFLRRREAFSSMISDLEALASKNMLRTSTITYGLKEDKEQPTYVQVTVKLSVEGTYADLIQFINSLEKSDLFWLIDSLQVSGSAGNVLRMGLSMQTIAVLPEQKSEL